MNEVQFVDEFRGLSKDQQNFVRAAIALPPPTGAALNFAWRVIISSLAVVLVGGLILLFLLIYWERPTELIAPIVTAALGAVVGLIAPSPMKDGTGG